MKRGIFDLILFLSLFLTPWWVGVFLALGGLFLFKNFYEFFVAGVIFYSLYLIADKGLISLPILFSTFLIFFYFIIQALKQKIILYKNETI
jgi:hypothetical protein